LNGHRVPYLNTPRKQELSVFFLYTRQKISFYVKI